MLAIAVWLGAIVALPAPSWVGVLGVCLALLLRRPALLVVAASLLAAALSHVAWAGLQPPAAARVHASALLLSDPVQVGHATRVDLRIGTRRVEAWARADAAAGLRGRMAGEVVEVDGRLRAPPEPARARLAVRHVAARLDLDATGAWRSGSVASRAANEVRRVLARGMASMPSTHAALLRGFLIGDDRDVPPAVESDFRASGLTHLLAVSGSNVAFVLAVVGPIVRRLQLRGRLVTSLAVIGFFALVTRAEPSVLRASAMAALACWTAFAGRPASRVRILSLAVAALVLVDPMLVRSVGFQLSVGASLGLVLLARPIADRLPGPRWITEPLGVTIAAQVGVTPVMVTTFGGVPVVTIVANLLAVPIAGPLTAWGIVAGLAAGVLGGLPAALLHLPSSVMVAWVAGVARAAAALPLGSVDGRDVAVAAIAAAVSWRHRKVAMAVALALLLVLARPTAGITRGSELARGAHLWRAGASVLVLDGGTDVGRVLDELRQAGVRRLDLVVARRGTPTIGGVLLDLRSRVTVVAVVAPAGHRVRGAVAVSRAATVELGDLSVRLRPAGDRLEVDVAV